MMNWMLVRLRVAQSSRHHLLATTRIMVARDKCLGARQRVLGALLVGVMNQVVAAHITL